MRPRALQGDTLDRFAESYLAGAPIAELATEFGIAMFSVRRYAKRLGLPSRARARTPGSFVAGPDRRRNRAGSRDLPCKRCGGVERTKKRYCRRCAYAASKRWREAHRERVNELGRRARARNPEREKAKYKRYHAKHRDRINASVYGLSVESYRAMRVTQGGLCALCGREPKRLYIDHDHLTGAVRALLCQACNAGLGLLRDDPARLRAAAAYIERHRGPTCSA